MTTWQNDPYFQQALIPTLRHEGIFSDDPDDPGGPTKYGWSLRTLKIIGDSDGDGWLDGDLDHDGDVDIDDIKMMTIEQASELYFSQFWDRYGYARLSPLVGAKIFDLSVNMGPGASHKLVQRGVRATGGPALVDDGKLGPRSLAAISTAQPEQLVVAVRSEAAGYYRSLVAAKASRRKYIAGWLTRAYS